jgi:hypothetical protein
MVLSIMVPHFPAIGSGGVPPVPPTILMSAALLGILYTCAVHTVHTGASLASADVWRVHLF